MTPPHSVNKNIIQIGLLLVAGIMICSCAPSTIPPHPERKGNAMLSDTHLISNDGYKLPLRTWFPSGTLNGVIIGVHGFNDYSNFIKDCAPFFNKHGLAVYSYDQRGFGDTETRGRWSGRAALSSDLAVLIDLVNDAHPHTPLFILGDSMGSAVTITTMVNHKPAGVAGIILVAPAVWARSTMPLYQRIALWMASHTVPWLKVSGKSLDIVASDNIEMLRELGRDPLVIKESRIETLYGLSNLMDQAYALVEELQLKTLVLYGQRDEIIPATPVMAFIERLPYQVDGRQQSIIYENGYHMLLRDLQAEVVLADIVDWIKNQVPTTTTAQDRELTRNENTYTALTQSL